MSLFNNSIKIITFSLIIFGCSAVTSVEEQKLTLPELIDRFTHDVESRSLDFEIPPGSRVRDFEADSLSRQIRIVFNKNFAARPFRRDNVDTIYRRIMDYFGEDYSDYEFNIEALDHNIKELIPNFYRASSKDFDTNRIFSISERPVQIVRNISGINQPVEGLSGRNIALWHSHGWYYNVKTQNWEWQRPRLFETVEDLLPMSVTIPYLIPMLESAGATVFIPRERDFQVNEVVVDNDTQRDSDTGSYVEFDDENSHRWQTGVSGFLFGVPPYELNYNPFEHGTHRFTESDSAVSARIHWIPNIPETGFYSVYVSYSASDINADDAPYTVYHDGGKTEFHVNQRIGGGTWLYLGRFKFRKGFNEDNGVVLTNKSSVPGRKISADAVRFGGGMGVVKRDGYTSGRPKFVEGAKYYMQYAGMPDTLVYNFNDDMDDYNDDYKSRPEYVNYLFGAPFGPNEDRLAEGLGIPIDISLSFHTDAGITNNDTTIGTLAIYSIEDADSNIVFPNGISRIANRDLADIFQTQIVEDIRAKYDPAWNRRRLYEAQYSEAFRPNVPSVLMELLSHQNFLDMKFMLDPRFRFDVARSMYKAILKFLSVQNEKEYTVQPLPPRSFSVEYSGGDSLLLKWEGTKDPLEETADPEGFIIYTRMGEGDFDNGVFVDSTSLIVPVKRHDAIYSFKVTAVNKGGESFPSEILSASILEGSAPVLIVNAFDRICGPESIDSPAFSGFLSFRDRGVPDKYELNFTGYQYDFDRNSEFVTNESPGHGASAADCESHVISGNTFDFPFVHGKSLAALGYSFVSCSDEAISNGQVELEDYRFVDIIFGEEKETGWSKSFADEKFGAQFKTFDNKFKELIKGYLANDGSLFISGAHIGTDLFDFSRPDSVDVSFAEQVLKYRLANGYAGRTGNLFSVNDIFGMRGDVYSFNTLLNDSLYAVESPDALNPVNGGETLLRYSENSFSAAVGCINDSKVVAFGFPFETIISAGQRNFLMSAVLKYLGINRN